jgi:hypothetical protein
MMFNNSEVNETMIKLPYLHKNTRKKEWRQNLGLQCGLEKLP